MFVTTEDWGVYTCSTKEKALQQPRLQGQNQANKMEIKKMTTITSDSSEVTTQLIGNTRNWHCSQFSLITSPTIKSDFVQPHPNVLGRGIEPSDVPPTTTFPWQPIKNKPSLTGQNPFTGFGSLAGELAYLSQICRWKTYEQIHKNAPCLLHEKLNWLLCTLCDDNQFHLSGSPESDFFCTHLSQKNKKKPSHNV